MKKKIEISDILLKEIRELYEQGESFLALGKRFGYNPPVLRRRFIDAGYSIRRKKDAGGIEDNRIIQAHTWYMEERDRTIYDVCQKFLWNKRTVIDRFKLLNLPRKKNETHHYKDLAGMRFGRCVVLEKTNREKAGGVKWKCICDCGNEFFTYSQNLLSGHTKGCGCGRTGEKHGGFNKDGRSIYKSGYVFVKNSNHPRSTKAGWVREHIVVMEKMIGRFLTDQEEVHHKNGIKDDNSEGNLELWNRSHPVGARVEDLIEYSMRILSLYRPETLKSMTP